MGLLGIGSIIASSMNAKAQNNMQVQALRHQKKENELAREYNLNLAKQQNQWNIEQWKREQAALEAERGYNSPAAQKARLQAAGLNADLMYGQGGVSNVSTSGAASSAPMTAGAPATPMDWSSLANRKTIGSAIMDALNIEQMRANIKKTEAEAKETGLQSDILASDASFRDAWNSGLLELQNMDILGKFSEIELNDQQVKESQSRIKKLDAETVNLIQNYDLIKAQISNLDADTAYKKLKGVLESKEVDALVKKLHADTNLSRAECRSIVSRLPYELLGLKADAEYTSTQSEFCSLQNDVLSFQFDQDKSYDDWKRSSMIAGSVVNCLEGVASIIGTAFGGGKPTRIRGFR